MSGGSSHTPARCLYEVLQISRTASDADIKKAYRKAALQWHPDKNVGNEAAAKTAFQEITHAYSVLSDKQERQWYDDHRDDILRGDEGGSDGEGAGASRRVPDLFAYFRADAFSGFGDNEQGFYAVYARAFQEIFDAEAGVREEEAPAPPMGSSAAPYSDVAQFYAYWSHFPTRLSFSWEDEYNPNEAQDRRTRRYIEKENAKARSAAKRKYQDEIRALVDFCKRRDLRVLEEKLRLRRLKETEAERKKADAAAKAREMAQLRAEWLAQKELEEAQALADAEANGLANGAVRLADLSSDDGHDDKRRARKSKGKKKRGAKGGAEGGAEEVEVAVYRCAICKKDFRSDKQLVNHESSTAHKKRVKQAELGLLREARKAEIGRPRQQDDEEEEEDDEGGSGGGSSSSSGSRNGSGGGDSDLDDYIDSAIAEIELGFRGDVDEAEEPNGTDFDGAGAAHTAEAAEAAAAAEAEEEGTTAAGAGEKGGSSSAASEDDASEADSEEEAPIHVEAASSRARRKRATFAAAAEAAPAAAQAKQTKTAKRRAKKKAQEAGGDAATAGAAVGPHCRVCGERFGSKSKLFQHIKQTGHARADA